MLLAISMTPKTKLLAVLALAIRDSLLDRNRIFYRIEILKLAPEFLILALIAIPNPCAGTIPNFRLHFSG